MNEQDARRILEDLRAQIVTTEKRLGALRKLVDGYVELFPQLSEAVSPRLTREAASSLQPKGQDAVRRLLIEGHGDEYTVTMTVAHLSERGWLPSVAQPSNAVRAALNRLVSTDPEHFRKRRVGGSVTYAYVDDTQAAARGEAAVAAVRGGSVGTGVGEVIYSPATNLAGTD